MSFPRNNRARIARTSSHASRKFSHARTPQLESLEERRLLTTIPVTSNGDGPLAMGTTLREAILMANLLPGADTITFNISGSTTIHPITALPPVTGPTTIDGTTQPGFSGSPVIFIEGTGTLPELITASTDGLRFTGGSSTLRGVAIGGFIGTDAAAVRVSGSDYVIAGNWIGTDASGAADDGNLQGIVVEAASNMRIGGSFATDRNVISGNFLDGILFNGTGSGDVVAGNYIGVTAAGDARLANQLSGIDVQALAAPETTNLVIGGTAAGARNVISGNNFNGITVTDVSGVQILGNYVGVDATGSTAAPNDANGILLQGSSGAITIGGIGIPGRNVISDNSGDGVRIDSSGSGIVVQGNFIGTDASGAAAIGNDANGVEVLSGAALIGGSSAGAGNVISGNEGNGVQVGSNSSVQYNLIGIAADGTTALGNAGDGIYIDGSDNSIGTPATGNSIAYNGGTGISVALSPADLRNAIRGDNIYLNGRLGIDLGDDGVTMNDPLDPDVGPNNFQNFPVLTSVTLSGGSATISGTLNSTPLSQFVIDFFASQIWDTTTYGEGQKYLGSTTVTTDAAGNASFTATVGGVPAGWNYFAATATDASGNTSEFSYDPTPGAAPQSPAASSATASKPKSDKSDLKSLLA